MTQYPYPPCQGPDPDPTLAKFSPPAGVIDCHAHIFGPESKYPYSTARGYTPPDASLKTYLELHKALGGGNGEISRAVLTQPAVYYVGCGRQDERQVHGCRRRG